MSCVRKGVSDWRVGVLVAAAVLATLSACAAPQQVVEQELPVYPPPPEQPRYYFERTIWGSNDVAKLTGAERFKQFATGISERGRGFAKPFGVVAVRGRVFVTDSVARRVAVLDFPNGRYYEIGKEGVGKLSQPLGIAADQVGRIYVTDATAKRVQVYDLDGNHLLALGGEQYLQRPSDVAVNADGSRIYVVDTGGVASQDHGIRVFDNSGKHLFNIGTRGKGEGDFNLPLAATVDDEGKLYVVDTGNFRVQVFTPNGQFIRSYGRAGRNLGDFSHPKGITVDSEGKIFVADTGFSNFQIFDPDFRLLLFIGERSQRSGPGRYLLLAGISVDVDGRIYLVDQFFRKVDIFRPAGLPENAPFGKAPGEPAT